MIKEIYIEKLHGINNIRIPFDSPYKVVVADNGFGKTTILNLIHFLFIGDTVALRNMRFSKVTIVFENDQLITLDKTKANNSQQDSKPRLLRRLIDRHGIEFVETLLHIYKVQGIWSLQNTHIYHTALSSLPVREEELLRALRIASKYQDYLDNKSMNFNDDIETHNSGFINEHDFSEHVLEIKKILQKRCKFKMLFWPTYRRIEAPSFGILNETVKDKFPTSGIQFGLDDVKQRITYITERIKNLAYKSFTQLNGQVLSQLISIDNLKVSDEMIQKISNPKDIQLILDRIGENISKHDKQQIILLIQTNKILDQQYAPLVNFLVSLLQVYEEQKKYDNAIKAFLSVCNKYLNNKYIDYDESKVSLSIWNKPTKKFSSKIINDWNDLSSGEKQIISLFSMLYLDDYPQYGILFDEPELSLSIEWQQMLLPDIIASGRCAFLFATTHSPFIFENELISNTVAISEYIKEL